MSAPATNTRPLQRLMAQLDAIKNHKVPGWTVNETKSGRRTVYSPRGQARIPTLNTLTEDAAFRALGRMNELGFPARAAKTSTTRPSVVRDKPPAPSTPEPDPTVYEGDPPADAGPVRRKVFLTPQLAKELGARPWSAVTSDGVELRQREYKQSTTDGFKEAILHKRSAVELNPQGLQIGLNGSLYDGQHRRAAVEELGEEIGFAGLWVYIDYNVHPDKIEGTDSGRGRRRNTKLFMRNYDHANQLSAAAALVHCFGEYEAAIELDSPEDLVPWERWPRLKLSQIKIERVVEDNPGLYEWLKWAVKAPQVKPRLQRSSVAAFAYLADQAWPDEERKYIDDEGCHEVDPLWVFLDLVVSGIGARSGDEINFAVKDWLNLRAKDYTHCPREAEMQLLLWAWMAVNKKRRPKAAPNPLPERLVLPYRP